MGGERRRAGRLGVIEVIEPGPLTSVQEPFGRDGWRHLGVPAGGAADRWNARLANRLVGNEDRDALLEITLGGAAMRLDEPTVVALTGGLSGSIDGVPLELEGRRIRAGATLRVEPGWGARGYLAVAGGIAVEPVLGSASTDLRTGFGGLDGRALRAGDRLEVGQFVGRPARAPAVPGGGPVRIMAGPYGAPLDALVATAWTVGAEADRTGVRLDGARLGDAGEIPSMGLPLGAIQVPPDGRPIVMLADRPVTGGYPVVACVIGADMGRVAQLRTGDAVRFASVSKDEAILALREAEDRLARLEPIGALDDEDLGWAGSHE
jgi:5-oxoprolinase (ATP-hydrolysing) subunit C